MWIEKRFPRVPLQAQSRAHRCSRPRHRNSNPAAAPPGDLDTTFDGHGLVITDFNPAINDEANAVAIQADGKVVAAGVAFFGRLNDFGLAR
jgi:hypothetical protein